MSRIPLALVLALPLAGCGADLVAAQGPETDVFMCSDGQDNDGDGTKDCDDDDCRNAGLCAVPGDGGDPDLLGALELCGNGVDDNGNGQIDEGCPCAIGETQPCYPGDAKKAGVGACKMGAQSCRNVSEFDTWGDCVGAVMPVAEICDEMDNDCDGVTDNGTCVPDFRVPPDMAVVLPDLVGSTDLVMPEDLVTLPDLLVLADLAEPPPDLKPLVVTLKLSISGDCVTASCPAKAPFPIGCKIAMSGDDPRGCVANTPGKSVVYFQEGDRCGAGHVDGTLTCSSQLGAPLSAATCPINKTTRYYPADRSGCPKTN